MSSQAAAGRPGNGVRRWLRELILAVEARNRTLRRLAPRIKSRSPKEDEFQKACEALEQLCELVEDALGHIARSPRLPDTIRGLAGPLRRLGEAADVALEAVDVYGATLGYERRRGLGRTTAKFSQDRKHLHQLRRESKGKLDDLFAHSGRLLQMLRSC